MSTKRRTNKVQTQIDPVFSSTSSSHEYIRLFLMDCQYRNLSIRSI